MSLQGRITALAQAIGGDIKAIQGQIGPPGIPALKPLLIYYGYPIAYKGLWDVGVVVADIAASFKVWVVGHAYQDPTHEAHASTAAIIAGVRAAGVKVYGYIPLGTAAYNLSQGQMQQATQEWMALGIDGIFLDEFGFDYGSDRQRQADIVAYVHSQGLPVCANAWVFEEFACDHINELPFPVNDWRTVRFAASNPNNLAIPRAPGDSFLIENFCFGHTGPEDIWSAQERPQLARQLASSKSIDLWAVAVFGESTPGTLDANTLGTMTSLGNAGAYISANALLYDIAVVGSGGYSFGSSGTPLWAPLMTLPAGAQIPISAANNDYTAQTAVRFFGPVRVEVTNTTAVQSLNVSNAVPAVLSGAYP